jgi:hypothetical protein
LYQITQGNKKTKHQKAEETREDQWRDFWMCETRLGATPWQLHDDDDNAFFSENCAIYEIMLKNTVVLQRPQMTTCACTLHEGYLRLQIHTQTHTHICCVILMAFPLQQWLHVCTSMLYNKYMAFLVCFILIRSMKRVFIFLKYYVKQSDHFFKFHSQFN